MLSNNQEESALARVWSKVILLIHTYNFFTIFFFLGLQGFPTGVWLAIEIITEVLIMTDFIMRVVVRRNWPETWQQMWLLHDKGTRSKVYLALRFIGSIPQSLILTMIFRKNPEALIQFHFAALRCLKVLRLRQISQYFDAVEH